MERFIFNFRHFIIPSEAQNFLDYTKKVEFDFSGFDTIPLSLFERQESYWQDRFSKNHHRFSDHFRKSLNQYKKDYSLEKPEGRSDRLLEHRNFIDYITELIRWRTKEEIIQILQFLYPSSAKHFDLLLNSKVFCTAPWFGLNIHPAGKMFPCCAYDQKSPLGSLADKTIDQIRQSEPMAQLKQAFTNQTKVKGCQSCYNSDDAGGDNLKAHLKNIHLLYIPLISLAENSKEQLPLLYLDVQFSNTCNLKCRICGPDFSSSWVKDYESMYNITEHPFKPKSIKRQYPEKWSSMLDTIKDVDEVYFWGGEPLLMTEHYEFLNRLIESDRPNVRLRYSTNFSELSPGHWNVIPLWRKFNRITVGASLDGSRERAELMRKGLSWEKVLENRKRLMDEVPHARFFIACATSTYNILHIPDFFKEWIELGLIREMDFCVNLLYEPRRLSVQTLPAEMKLKATEKIYDLIENFIRPNFGDHTMSEQRFAAAAHHMNQADFSSRLPEFVWYNNQVDHLRKEKLIEVFPELTPIFERVSQQSLDAIQL